MALPCRRVPVRYLQQQSHELDGRTGCWCVYESRLDAALCQKSRPAAPTDDGMRQQSFADRRRQVPIDEGRNDIHEMAHQMPFAVGSTGDARRGGRHSKRSMTSLSSAAHSSQSLTVALAAAGGACCASETARADAQTTT